jgi:hypothetical protein
MKQVIVISLITVLLVALIGATVMDVMSMTTANVILTSIAVLSLVFFNKIIGILENLGFTKKKSTVIMLMLWCVIIVFRLIFKAY